MKTIYTEFGIDVQVGFYFEAHIYFTIKATQNDEYVIISFPFSDFLKKLHEIEPDVAQYIERLKSSLTGYGPKEEKAVDILLEEDFDFEKYFIQVIESYDNYIGSEIERMKRIYSNPESLATLEEIRDVLESTMPRQDLRYGEILDALEQAIVKHLVDNYPELTESKPENIIKLKDILGDYIPDLGSDIIELIAEIRDDEDEMYEQSLK